MKSETIIFSIVILVLLGITVLFVLKAKKDKEEAERIAAAKLAAERAKLQQSENLVNAGGWVGDLANIGYALINKV